MSVTRSSSVVTRKHDELYGIGRLNHVQKLKNNLTTDHITLISEEGMKIELPTWQSTSKINFKGTQPYKEAEQTSITEKQRFYQDKSHFEFKGDAAPIDDVIYQTSITSQDYKHKQTQSLPPVKPDGNINLPDMNPRYWRDDQMGTSLYAVDFSNTEVRHDIEIPEVSNERNEMRRRNVEDLRSTHFCLGNDPLSFHTETEICYNTKKPLPAVGVTKRGAEGEPTTAAELTQRMIEQERDSAIFRDGDYNVTNPKPQTTTFTRDYNANDEKPYKSAAFVEPTRTQKGRFLIDSPLKNSVEQEASRYPGPSETNNNVTGDHMASSSALKQMFTQYDTKSSGYVSKYVLRRVCDSLLHPIKPTDLENILKHTTRGKDGDIDYRSFIDQFVELQTRKQPRNGNVNDADNGMQTGETKQKSGLTPMTSLFKHKELPLDSGKKGKKYQTSAHFKFGNDTDKPSTIYKNDFQSSKDNQQQSLKANPPPSSEVMHKLPVVNFGQSTKQLDFIDFKEASPATFHNSIVARDQASLKNKMRHAVNNVVLAGDKEKDAQDRQYSLSHSSYVPHERSVQLRTITAPQSKYNYLHSDGALPYPANTPHYSETSEAFTGVNALVRETAEAVQTFNNDNKERTKEGKRAHFRLGNDDANHVTEAMNCFRTNSTHVQKEVEAAGIRNQEDPQFAHHQVSKNTQDLLRDPMTPSTFQAQMMAKKSYYNIASNPKDPLHIKLRNRLKSLDKDLTGRLDKRMVKVVCRECQIPVSDYAMENLLQRCESDFGDETVDYQKFLRSLTIEQVPNSVSAAHSYSIMMKDYKPLDQRSFTNAQIVTMEHMDSKPIVAMPTHFFHVDGSGENQFESLTMQDYPKPELQT